MDANAWIAVVATGFAFVALFFTALQVRLAREQTELQRQTLRDASQPYVWADIRPDARQQHILVVLLRNEGPTVATDVTVAFDPPVPMGLATPGDRGQFRISAMPPGRQMVWPVQMSPDWISGDHAKRFVVTVTAVGQHGPTEPLVYELDVEDYRQNSASPPGTLFGVTEAVKGLTKAVQGQGPR